MSASHAPAWTLGRTVIVLLATLGLVVPRPIWAAQPGPLGQIPIVDADPTVDVSLQRGDCLVGQVVDPQGVPQANTEVAIAQRGQNLALARTDSLGRFAFSGVSGGTYLISGGGSAVPCRCWTAESAPPVSKSALLIVRGDDVVRGQMGGAIRWIVNPWVITTLVAAAIAVPIAINSINKGPQS